MAFFPDYELATRRRLRSVFVTFQKSNLATKNWKISISTKIEVVCAFITSTNYVPTATTSPIFDKAQSDMALPTLCDIDRHPKLNMSTTKPHVEITLEWKEVAKRFSSATPAFAIMPDSKISPHREINMAANKPDVEITL